MKKPAYCLPLVVLLSWAVVGGCARPKPVDPDLIGVWEAATASPYQGASFEITPTTIVFRKDQRHESANRIRSIEPSGNAKGAPVFTIHYRNASGGEQSLEIIYMAKPDPGTIRFKNQPHLVWNKAAL